MKIQIPINGISTSSDYKDGDMMSLVNLRKKTGVLEPVPPRKITKTLSDVYDLVFVHQLPSTKKNWIGVKDNAIYLDADNTKTPLCSTTSLISITQIGNVLNILDAEGIKYLLWYDNEYKLISTAFDGTQEDIALPAGKIELRTNATYDPPTVYLADSAISGSSSEATVSEVIKGLFAKAISVERKRGYLKGFVLACTAYELFDGSVILHSNPVLIGQPVDARTRYSDIVIGGVECNYLDSPIVAYQGSAYGIHKTTRGVEYLLDEYRSFKLFAGSYFLPVAFPRASVRVSGVGGIYSDFHYPDPADDDWEEYWTRTPLDQEDGRYPWYEEGFEDHPAGAKYNCYISTDLFLVERKVKRGTTPIPLPNMVGYMQVESVDRFPSVISRRSEFQVKIEKNIPELLKPLVRSVNIYITQEVLMYKDVNFKRTSRAEGSQGKYHDNYLPDLKSDEEIKEELMSQENFYKVKEIFPNDIVPGEWVTIDLKDKLGENLRNQEELPQDPMSHHLILPKKQYVYNSRLHVADYERLLSRGFPARYFENVNSDVGQFKSKDYPTISATPFNKVFAEVKIKTEQGDAKVVRYDFPSVLEQKGLAPILSYPDRNAKSLRIVRQAQGYPVIIEYGVVVGETENPTVEDNWRLIRKTGSFIGTYNQPFSGGPLQRGTTYHIRAYCKLSDNTYQYGEDKTFTTLSGDIELSLDLILTQKVWTDKVEVTRNLIANNGEPILEAGVVYGTNPTPTVENSNKTSGSTNIGSYDNTISGLEPATLYYARAYARNKYGVYYSSPIRDFMTLDPTETFEISPISEYNIFSDKLNVDFAINLGTKEDILDGGIVWSKSPNPYINTSPHTSGITAVGSYTRQATGLDLDTVYYVRAWARNKYGTFYSSQVSARTKPVNPNYTISTILGVGHIDRLFINSIQCKVEIFGDAILEEWGICYSFERIKPTIADSISAGIASPNANGVYYADINPAINNMAYYIRAYAKTQYGISYSEVLSIWTLD